MYCSKCGTQLPDTAHFCQKCGERCVVEPIAEGLHDEGYVTQDQDGLNAFPLDMGDPIKIFKKQSAQMWATIELGDWPRGERRKLDVVLTPTYILFAFAEPTTKPSELIGKVGLSTGYMGPVSLLLVGMPVVAVARLHEKAFGRHNSLDITSLQNLFESGNLFFVERKSCRFLSLEYLVSKTFLSTFYAEFFAIRGRFIARVGIIEGTLLLAQAGIGMERSGCPAHKKEKFKTESELTASLNR